MINRFEDAVRANDLEQVRAYLHRRPELVGARLGENQDHEAMHYALFNRSPEMVRLLMQHGANAHCGIYPNLDATSPMTLAAERGYHEIVEIIQKKARRPRAADTHDPNAWPETLVNDARSRSEDRIITFLEANPRYINIPYYKMAPLHVAVVNGMERLLIWLLDHGADVNLRDRNGPSPLELVGYTGRRDRISALASILLERGAEITPRAAIAIGDAELASGAS